MDDTMNDPRVPRNPMARSRRDDVMSAIYAYHTVNLNDTLARLARARQNYSDLTIGELVKWAKAVCRGEVTTDNCQTSASASMKIVTIDHHPFFVRITERIGQDTICICAGDWVETEGSSRRYVTFRHEFDVTASQDNHLPLILYDHGAVEFTTWSKICNVLTGLVRDGGTADENLE